MAAMLAIGWYTSKKVKNSLDFINAGRSLGLPIATATLFASWFCGGTILGAAGAAYEGGLSATVADPFGAGVVLILAGLFVLRPMRRMGVSTVVTFYERRYNNAVGFFSSIAQMICYLGWLGAILVAFGFTMSMMTGLGTTVSIGLSALIVMVYTAAGGMWAVAITDFVQMIILVIGLLVMLPIVMKAIGGWSSMRASLPAEFFHLWPRGGNFEIWMAYVAMWLSLGLGCLPEQALVQRGTSAKNEKTAVWCGYLGGCLYLTIGLIPPILGMAAILLMPEVTDSEMVVLFLAREYLPTIGIVIFLSGMLAALMSSADSAALAPASILGDNVLRYVRPGATDRQVLRTCQVMVPVFIIISGLVGMRVQAVYNLMVDAYTVLLVSLVVPLLGGLYWKKANSPGAAAAILSGLGVWAFFYVRPTPFSDLFTPDLLGLFTSLLFFVAVSLATQRSHPPKELVDMDGKPMSPRDMLGIISPFGSR
jgi:Na+/proline symporter